MTSEEITTGERVAECRFCDALRVAKLSQVLKHSNVDEKEMELFVVRWMELESVIQSEVSQKEKNKYSMLTHIYGI